LVVIVEKKAGQRHIKEEQMKRRIGMIVLAVLFVVFCVSVSSVWSAQKPIKIKWASVMGAPGIAMNGDYAKSYQEDVTKRTNGAVTFESYWASSLGAPAEYIEMLQKGLVQMVQTYEWYTPSRLPLADLEYAIPFGVTDPEIAAKTKRQMREEFPEFNKELQNNNAVLLASPPTGALGFLSVDPIRSLDDFKGRKVGCVGRYFGRMLPPGATAVVRPAHERYDLLRSGVISVDANPWDNFYAFKLHEVTNYYLDNLAMFIPIAMPFLINQDTFKSLDPETQKIMLDAGKNLEMRAAREIQPQWRKKVEDSWKAKGLKWITFPDSEKAKWAASLEDIPAEWAAEMEKLGLPGFKIINRWQEISAGMGHKWNRKWGVKK
jgi:TRAP-type transport system periplasmic protein